VLLRERAAGGYDDVLRTDHECRADDNVCRANDNVCRANDNVCCGDADVCCGDADVCRANADGGLLSDGAAVSNFFSMVVRWRRFAKPHAANSMCTLC
jgi:hypothetical protein